jgi:membrane protease YdiL (CAAX protease family)
MARGRPLGLPVYATLIDVGCLALLSYFTRREGIALRDLISFDRRRWRRDVLLGFGLIPISLAIIVTGISISSYIVFGTTEAPTLLQPLPLLPTLYGVLIFPLVWGFTEEMTYNGYLAPRTQFSPAARPWPLRSSHSLRRFNTHCNR